MAAAHIATEFTVSVDLPYAIAFPLFGAWQEQQWANGWTPQFLHPDPPADVEGSVFLVNPGSDRSAVWVMTRFDLSSGKIQYVSVVRDLVASRLDLHVARDGDDRTTVSVRYERTALRIEAGDLLRTFEEQDRGARAEWSGEIEAYVRKLKANHA